MGRGNPQKAGRLGPQAGVTLLELLVGLTLFVLLMVLLTRSESFVLNAWRTGDEEVARQQELSECLGVMLKQVRSAAPLKPPGGPRQSYGFVGGRDRLSFITTLPAAKGGEPGLWLVTYGLAPGGPEGGLLVAEERPALDSAVWRGGAPAVEGVSLLAGVSSLRFTYLERSRQDDQLAAKETWLSGGAPKLPAAVQVDIVADGRQHSWLLPVACGAPR